MTGYSRDQFGPAWSDAIPAPLGHNGCDTRNDILRCDLLPVQVKPGTNGCVALTGTLHDPYTSTVIAFRRGAGTSTQVQIDHVVALGDAWQTGAQRWTAATRTEFANDPLNLLAVSGSANEAKGDADAASWLPANQAYRCSYVARQVAAKARYHLWVTRAEHDAIADVLGNCPVKPPRRDPRSRHHLPAHHTKTHDTEPAPNQRTRRTRLPRRIAPRSGPLAKPLSTAANPATDPASTATQTASPASKCALRPFAPLSHLMQSS